MSKVELVGNFQAEWFFTGKCQFIKTEMFSGNVRILMNLSMETMKVPIRNLPGFLPAHVPAYLAHWQPTELRSLSSPAACRVGFHGVQKLGDSWALFCFGYTFLGWECLDVSKIKYCGFPCLWPFWNIGFLPQFGTKRFQKLEIFFLDLKIYFLANTSQKIFLAASSTAVNQHSCIRVSGATLTYTSWGFEPVPAWVAF